MVNRNVNGVEVKEANPGFSISELEITLNTVSQLLILHINLRELLAGNGVITYPVSSRMSTNSPIS